MFTFTFAFFAAIDISLFIFKLFPLFTESGRRNLEESVHNENQIWSLCLLCSILFIFSERKCSLKENLRTINRKTEFPDVSPALTITKIFPNFLKNSLTLPWPWTQFRFSLAFPWPRQPWYIATRTLMRRSGFFWQGQKGKSMTSAIYNAKTLLKRFPLQLKINLTWPYFRLRLLQSDS